MKNRTLALTFCFLLVSGLASLAQNNCTGTPAYGTCPAPGAAPQVWCAGNNSSSTCSKTTWIGFNTVAPGSGSWTDQFEGLDAVSILATDIKGAPGAQPDPNGAVGPTNASGVGQYLEFADNFVQAFDRTTGQGIFATRGVAQPQSILSLFSPGGSSYCTNPSLDGIASYDRIDGVFVIANFFKSQTVPANYYFCIGASAPAESVPASNLQGVGGDSFWNVYAYQMNAAIPLNPQGYAYFPDYVRFGNWADGFYITFDLEDVSKNYDIVGFEVCKLDKADIIAGLSSNSPQCYTYIPSYVVGTSGTDKSLIHSLVPADFEGENAIPSNTAGEYFFALVNPSNPGTNVSCSKAPCTSNELAFWTWSGFTSGAAPTSVVLKYHAFTPGCYTPSSPYNTYCIPEPYNGSPGVIDSLGDRLTYRLAYRYDTTAGAGEFLALTHTVQETAGTRRTGIRYYKFKAGATPTLELLGDIQDTTNYYFLSMPSVAMDNNGDLGITYTVTGDTTRGSLSNYDPSPFFVTVSPTGVVGTPVAILANSGTSGQDETDSYWGEYVSVTSDPDNDLTFWAVDEYMNGNQTTNCSYKTGIGTGCTWASRIFTCQKGSGC